MSFFPFVNSSGDINDGTFFRLLPFCKKKCLSSKCKTHYEQLKEKATGAYCCPYGLSSYIYEYSAGKIIFTGLKIKGVYDKNKAKKTECKDYIYNPVIDIVSCNLIAQEVATSLYEKIILNLR